MIKMAAKSGNIAKPTYGKNGDTNPKIGKVVVEINLDKAIAIIANTINQSRFVSILFSMDFYIIIFEDPTNRSLSELPANIIIQFKF